MPEVNLNPNPFRSVALVLISMTIIVLGITYKQGTSHSEAQTSSEQSGMQAGSQSSLNTPNLSVPTITTPDQPIIPPSTTTPIDWTLLTDTLQTIEQLVKTAPIFAYTVPDINIFKDVFASIPTKDVPSTSNSLNLVTPTTPLPTNNVTPIPSADTITTTPTPQDNEVIAALKTITGVYKWEEFKEKFQNAQKEFSGTGKCMIIFKNVGCLMQW